MQRDLDAFRRQLADERRVNAVAVELERKSGRRQVPRSHVSERRPDTFEPFDEELSSPFLQSGPLTSPGSTGTSYYDEMSPYPARAAPLSRTGAARDGRDDLASNGSAGGGAGGGGMGGSLWDRAPRAAGGRAKGHSENHARGAPRGRSRDPGRSPEDWTGLAVRRGRDDDEDDDDGYSDRHPDGQRESPGWDGPRAGQQGDAYGGDGSRGGGGGHGGGGGLGGGLTRAQLEEDARALAEMKQRHQQTIQERRGDGAAAMRGYRNDPALLAEAGPPGWGVRGTVGRAGGLAQAASQLDIGGAGGDREVLNRLLAEQLPEMVLSIIEELEVEYVMAGRYAAGVLQRAVERGCGAGYARHPRVQQALGDADGLQLRGHEAAHRPARWDLSTVKRSNAFQDDSKGYSGYDLAVLSVLAGAVDRASGAQWRHAQPLTGPPTLLPSEAPYRAALSAAAAEASERPKGALRVPPPPSRSLAEASRGEAERLCGPEGPAAAVVTLASSLPIPDFLGPVSAVAASPCGRLLAAGTTGGEFWVWTVRPDGCSRAFRSRGSGTSNDAQAGSKGGKRARFPLAALAERDAMTPAGLGIGVVSLAFSPDSKLLSVSDTSGICRVWSLARGVSGTTDEEPELLIALPPVALPSAGVYKIPADQFFCQGAQQGTALQRSAGASASAGGGGGRGRAPQGRVGVMRGSAAFHPWVTREGAHTTASFARANGDVCTVDLLPGVRITLGGDELSADADIDDEGGPAEGDPTDTFNFGRGVSAPSDVAALLLRADEARGSGRADLLAGHGAPVIVAGYFPGSGKLLTVDAGGAVKAWPSDRDARGPMGWVTPAQEWQLPRALPSVVPAQPEERDTARLRGRPGGGGGVGGDGSLPSSAVPWLTYFRKKPSDGVDVMRREVVFREADADPQALCEAHHRSYEVTTGRLLSSTRYTCRTVLCPATVAAAEMAPSGDLLVIMSVDCPSAGDGHGWRHFSAFLLRAGSLTPESPRVDFYDPSGGTAPPIYCVRPRVDRTGGSEYLYVWVGGPFLCTYSLRSGMRMQEILLPRALPIGSALSGLVNMPPIGAQGSYGRAVPCIAAQRCTSKRGGGALGEEMMYRKLLSSRRWQRCTRVLLSV